MTFRTHLRLVGHLIGCWLWLTRLSAATLVVPPTSQDVDGQNGAGDLHHTIHIQTVYHASLFNTGPILIQEIRYRPSAPYSAAFTSSIPNLQLNLSSSAANPESLSGVFADNRGPNDTVVFQGPITLSSRFTGPVSGPKDFDIIIPLATPFLYDPATGHLVVETRNFTANDVTFLDATGNFPDGAGRVFSVDPQAASGAVDTGADVAQLVYSIPSTAPIITAQPQSATVSVGSTALLSVTAFGSPPLVYQWSFNGALLPNATGPTLTLANVALNQGGSYRVSVTNLFGQAVSSNALLTVFIDPPAISVQPRNTRVAIGSNALFAVSASGSPPLGYQWSFNGAALPSETNATLVLNAVTPALAGDYRVTVTSPYGQVVSSNASLQVYEFVPLSGPPGPSSRRTPLAISEIMYHPALRADGRNLEFVELFNSQPYPIQLDGFRLSGDVDFTFPAAAMIPATGFVVIAASPSDVEAVYAVSGMLGPFTNSLPNSTGTIRLRNKAGAILLQADYSDQAPWPAAADGAGHSLVLAGPTYGEGNPRAWAVSAQRGGSPGAADPIPTGPLTNVFINEILAHTHEPTPDFVELYNHSNIPVDVSGCVLTDDPATNKFRLDEHTSIPARGFLPFNQIQLGFALSAAGETVYLIQSNGTRVIDAVRFDGQADGVAYGRSPNGAPGLRELVLPTPGASNASPLLRDIVINEIMYHPVSGDSDDEYVELYNRGAAPLNVGGWRFIAGIDFILPDQIIPAGGYLVVARNAARLKTHYANLGSANLVGDFQGALSDRGERLALAMPQTLISTNPATREVTTNFSYVVVNEVTYGTGGRWGAWSDGGGASLELIDPDGDNRLAASWAAGAPPTQSAWTTIEKTGVLVLGDGFSPINALEMGLLGAGECLIDDVEVRVGAAANLCRNSDLSAGLTGWGFEGNHDRTTREATGGINNSPCLHLRTPTRVEYLGNRITNGLTSPLTRGTTVTIRAKAKWLRGTPEILFRLRGNDLEAAGTLAVPLNLGTPGAKNSPTNFMVGPVIYDVSHQPVLPQAGQPVLVTARVSDRSILRSVILRYRLDPSSTATDLFMVDDGSGGDGVAGDGIYSAKVPGQAGGKLVGFSLIASNASGAFNKFPSDAPAREGLIRFGEPQLQHNLGTYRIWMTQATLDRWSTRSRIDSAPLDVTFVYNDQRAVYNVGAAYNGSDNTSSVYDTPIHFLCGYILIFPDDDLLLGATDFLLDWPIQDSSGQREQIAYWMAGELGLPVSYRRFVHVVINGRTAAQRPNVANDAYNCARIYDDAQQPSADFLDEWYPDDHEGELFKVQVHRRDYKFPFTQSHYNATLHNFVRAPGEKNVPSYRWTWRKRAARDSGAHNYTNLFTLVDAVNLPLGENYVRTVESLVDVEQWMRAFALEKCVGNLDSWGAINGQNMYAFKPRDNRWQLMLYDTDLVFGSVSESPSESLFTTTGGQDITDTNVIRLLQTPAFQRAYWRGFRDAVNGPMQPSHYGPVMDTNLWVLQQDSVVNSGGPVSAADTDGIKGWIDARRSFIQNQLNSVNADFTLTSPLNNFTTNRNVITLTGTAPIDVKTIVVNGIACAVTWTGVTTWRLPLTLHPGANALVAQGFDRSGHPFPGATATRTISFTGTNAAPDQSLVLNEIMYHPTTPGAEFVEIYNRSTSTAFDLGGWRLNGLDFTFPGGSVIGPTNFVVVVKDRLVFGQTYGPNLRVAGQFDGSFDQGGETLSLVKVDGTNEMVIDSVTYDDDGPWPPAADGAGPSLQLIDVVQDNDRVGNWAAAPATPGAANAVAASLPPFPLLWLNEVQPINGRGIADTFGDRDPWVELYQAATTNFPLAGLYLSDNYSNLTQWPFPAGATLGAGAFRLVWLDGEPGESSLAELHAGFRASPTNGSLALSRVAGGRTSIVDYVNYSVVAADGSFGSFPDGHPYDRHSFYYVTPGASNNDAVPPVTLWINEWMAGNAGYLADPAGGGFDDWFEIYNPGTNAVALAGFTLTDDLMNPGKAVIPDGMTIAPHGFLLVWADEESSQTQTNGDLHVNFKLSAMGERIALYDDRGRQIDGVTFGQQTDNVSQGRWPDAGSAPYFFFTTPTPRASNVPPDVTILAVVLSRDAVGLTWTTQNGHTYCVQFKDELSEGPWADLPGEVTATSNTASKADARIDVEGQRFYRVRLVR